MEVSDRAGKPAEPSMLVDVDRLIAAYYDIHPDPAVPAQAVAFGTSGHRGSSLNGSFNEDHILATSEAICRYRQAQGTNGPLFIGRDSHALSEPATRSAIEVLVANGVSVLVDSADGLTPTPSVSHAILTYNRDREGGLADGIVVTPSHNPPEDGGFKYNPPSGGPADTDVTGAIQDAANELLAARLAGVRRLPYERAVGEVGRYDFTGVYVADLARVVDMEAIGASGLKLGVDPLGGASVGYWASIRDRYHLDLTVTNEIVDPQFGFMTVDWDGRIRMDPSSPYAMARLVALKDRFDLAFATDTDADRHGIVTGTAGLMNPNHFLSAAVAYLYRNRDWRPDVAVGKTLVSTGMLDRVAAELPRKLVEVPVGFKWFVAGLVDGSLGFGGEESAGASFLRRDGAVWTSDKDGLIACLLAAELTARSGHDPAVAYGELTARFGAPAYQRIDAPATREQQAVLARLSPTQIEASELAGEPIVAVLTRAPGNDAPIDGVKVITEHGWFAARPSGTEEVYKVYAESFLGEEHLQLLLGEAQMVVTHALAAAGAGS
ncbi:MAG TPA: phosphoglucomutase (alpha-D-glucose-1,6-bisphosphate-dependent) [Candidatus Limnocylindrales bacterium]|nr:phosphoglucomutase (alpha-D-glucose-1,6-bisphosphate-dependent) [Candidatus Limnocylindrales bacterium]